MSRHFLSLRRVHRDRKRFVVRVDEKLPAFLELESAIRGCGELSRKLVKRANLRRKWSTIPKAGRR